MALRLAGIEARLVVLAWMVGGLYALLITIGVPGIWLLLRIAAKLGAL